MKALQRKFARLKKSAEKRENRFETYKVKKVEKLIVNELISMAKNGCYEPLYVYPEEFDGEEATRTRIKTIKDALTSCDIDLLVERLEKRGLNAYRYFKGIEINIF